MLWSLFAASAAVTAYTESEVVWVFLLSGVVAVAVRRWGKMAGPPAALGAAPAAVWVLSGLHGPASRGTLFQIAWYFAEAGAFVFGSGLAIVPFLYAGVVNEHHWLSERQFVDAVAVAMITPGPVVITVGFIGYLVAGLSGATVAALATFLPCYLFTVIPAPYFKKYGKRPALIAFVNGVTAAAIGAIVGAVVVLAERSIVDVASALIALVAAGLVWKVKRIPEPVIVAAAALIGVVLFPYVRGSGT